MARWADQAGVEGGLGRGVGRHGLSVGVQVPIGQGVGRSGGGGPQVLQATVGLAQVADDRVVYGARIVGPQVNGDHPPGQRFPGGRGQVQGVHIELGVGDDVDQVSPAESGRHLVLDPALSTQVDCFHLVGGVGQRGRSGLDATERL